MFSTVILLVAETLLQLSSGATVCVAQVPSSCGFGVISGKVPDEQHTICPGTRDEHKLESGLCSSNSAPVIPHVAARDSCTTSQLRVFAMQRSTFAGANSR